MKLVKFIDNTGQPVHVNPDQVTSVRPWGEKAIIGTSDGQTIRVRMPADKVIRALEIGKSE